MRRKVSGLLIIIMYFISLLSPVVAQGYQREIVGIFGDIQVNVNKWPLTLYKEPFIYEDEVYVPLKNLSQLLYINTEYDENNNKISIDTGNLLKNVNVQNFPNELLQKDYEINLLNQELRELEERLNVNIKSPYKRIDSVGEMEDYIQEHFSRLRGIPMDIDFRQYSGSRYRLYITIPREDASNFQDISQRVVENWLIDILYAVRELYDYDARINGYIRDDASSYRTYVSFESYNNDFDFNFRTYSSSTRRINVNERDLEKHLDKNISSYNGIDFTYKVIANRYDIDLEVHFEDRDFYDWSSTRQKNYLDRLQREIRNFKSGIDVHGKFIDDNDNKEVSRFRFLDNRVDYYEEISTSRYRYIDEIRENIKDEVEVEINPTVNRNLKAWFCNPSLEIDGVPFKLLKDVFMIDDEIYIAISDLGDALYWVFEYIPHEAQLNIVDNNFKNLESTFSKNTLLQEKELEKERLLAEVEALKEDVKRFEKTSSSYRSIRTISGMQNYLRDEFEDFEGIEMYIRLSNSRDNHYRLHISYPREDYDKFDDIKSSVIEGWIDAMYQAIKDLYDANATISGYIRNSSSSNLTYITFDTDSRDRLIFDFEDHGNIINTSKNIEAREIERVLERYLRRYMGVNFSYEVVVNRRDVDLNIRCTNDRFYRWDLEDKMDYLKEIREEIYDVYNNINVNGRIYDADRPNDVFRFSIEDGKILSYDLLIETEKYLNNNYGEYSHGDLNFKYTIHEKSNSLDIIMEGDFFKEEDSWRRIADNEGRLDEFEDFVVDVKGFVEDFWSIDVKVEVVDKAFSSLVIK